MFNSPLWLCLHPFRKLLAIVDEADETKFEVKYVCQFSKITFMDWFYLDKK